MTMNGAGSFDDGGNLVKKLQLPSDSRNGNMGSASSYRNQQLVGTSSFQHRSLLSHPFLNQQQLLLNNHLEMQ